MWSIWGSTTKARAKNKGMILKGLHATGIVAALIVVTSVLLALMIWLFIRMPDPQVHLTEFRLDAVDEKATTNMLHYSLTLHNPDRYKSLNFSVLYLRITFSKASNYYGELANFNKDGKGVIQGPGETTVLANHAVVNCTAISDTAWSPSELIKVKTVDKPHFELKFLMEVGLMALNRVVNSRQFMRKVRVYFNDEGKAFLLHHTGLRLE